MANRVQHALFKSLKAVTYSSKKIRVEKNGLKNDKNKYVFSPKILGKEIAGNLYG